jgi:hypothetical protein
MHDACTTSGLRLSARIFIDGADHRTPVEMLSVIHISDIFSPLFAANIRAVDTFNTLN